MKAPRFVALAVVGLLAAAACSSRAPQVVHTVTPSGHEPSTSAPTTTAAAELPFGAAAIVQGGNGSRLKATPFAAWWLANGGTDDSPSLGHFLIIEMMLSPVSAPAMFPVPLTGEGPEVISGDRSISDAGDDASNNVVWNTCLPVVDSDESLQPGDTVTQSETYDVPAQSGKLRWQDADGTVVTWRLPSSNTGPLPSRVKSAISSGNGC